VPALLQRQPAPGHQGRRAASPALDVKRIINEPNRRGGSRSASTSTARATAKIAVYDLGGGHVRHLDHRDRRRRRRNAVRGACPPTATRFLGGEDFDQRIIDFIVAEFKKETRRRPDQGRPSRLQRLKESRGKRPKIELSSQTQTDVKPALHHGPTPRAPKHLNIKLDPPPSSSRWWRS